MKNGGSIHNPSSEEKDTFVAAQKADMEWYGQEYGENGARWLAEFSKHVDAAR